jgi:hypothetical protein
MHAAEHAVLEPRSFKVEIAIEKLQRSKSPDIGQIPTNFIQAGGTTSPTRLHCVVLS